MYIQEYNFCTTEERKKAINIQSKEGSQRDFKRYLDKHYLSF